MEWNVKIKINTANGLACRTRFLKNRFVFHYLDCTQIYLIIACIRQTNANLHKIKDCFRILQCNPWSRGNKQDWKTRQVARSHGYNPEKEAKDFLDTTLPVLFQAVKVENVSIYAYPHFLYPHRGNHHQQKQTEKTAKTLQQLNLTVERVSKSHKRTTQRQQQRKLEVVFESNDQPPAPKKQRLQLEKILIAK